MKEKTDNKKVIKFLVFFSILLIIVLFSIIYISKKLKYNNKYVRDLSSYKKLNIELDNGVGYFGTINNYYDYESENLNSIYLFFDANEDIYNLLGNVKIKAKTKKATESEKHFNITYVPTYPANKITFQFHGDNIVIDGEEYKTEGLDEIRKYINEHTLTTDDIITYAGEDSDAINDKIKEVWHEGVATDTNAVKNSLPGEISNTITAKIYFSYYLYSTTGSGYSVNYYPVNDGFYLEYSSLGSIKLYAVNQNTEPLIIDNNPDEVREFINNNKTVDAE